MNLAGLELPDPPQPQQPDVLQQAAHTGGPGWSDALKTSMPFLLAAIAGKQAGPAGSAGALRGFAEAEAIKERNRQIQAENDARFAANEQDRQFKLAQLHQNRQTAVLNWQREVNSELAKVTDPTQQAALAQRFDQIGRQVFGDPGGISAPGVSAPPPDKTIGPEAAKLLDTLEKQHGQQFKDLVTRNATVTFRGKPMTIRQLQGLAGQDVTSPEGGAILPPAPKAPDAAAVVTGTGDWENLVRGKIRAFTQQNGRPPNDQEIAKIQESVPRWNPKPDTGSMDPLAGAAGQGLPNLAPGTRDEAFLKTLPTGTAVLVKKLADGQMAFPAGFALKSDYWQKMLSLVGRYDPSFDAVNYNARSKTRQDFTSGTSAKQVNALNTAIGHLEQLSGAIDALHNKDLRLYNQIANGLATEFGWTGSTDFDTIVKPVADELTRVWRGTGGSESDIAARLAVLRSDRPSSILHSAVAETGHLLQSKLDSLQTQYSQGMGINDVQMLTPKASQTLQMLEQKAGGGAPGAQSAGGATRTMGNGLVLTDQGNGEWKSSSGGVYKANPDGSFTRIR